MILLNGIQKKLSDLQTIPVAGPFVVSPVKIVVSVAQMVAGLTSGIFFGMLATSASIHGIRMIPKSFSETSMHGFLESALGFGSLLYASANMATLGILGRFVVEITQERKDSIFWLKS